MKELFEAIAKVETDPKEAEYMTNYTLERLEKFVQYFNVVYQDVIKSESNYALVKMGKIDTEELQYRITKMDSKRRICHETAIDACAQLNRECRIYNTKPFCPETKDRYEIADFIGRFVYTVYEYGQGKFKDKDVTLDEMIQFAKEQQLDPDKGLDMNVLKGRLLDDGIEL